MIQREIEKRGIATVGISSVRSYTERIRPPRSVHVPWSFGHPLGRPYDITQQTAVLRHALDALYTIKKPGDIIDLKITF